MNRRMNQHLKFQVQEQKQHQGIAGAVAAVSLSPSEGINSHTTHFVSECAMGREDAVRRALQSHPVDPRLLAKGLQVGYSWSRTVLLS